MPCIQNQSLGSLFICYAFWPQTIEFPCVKAQVKVQFFNTEKRFGNRDIFRKRKKYIPMVTHLIDKYLNLMALKIPTTSTLHLSLNRTGDQDIRRPWKLWALNSPAN